MITIIKHLLILCAWLSAENAPRDAWTVWTVVDAAHRIAPEYDLDPALLLAVSEVESTWSRTAGCDHDGRGCGLYQQVPASSQRWGDDCWQGPTYVCAWRNGEGVTREELVDVYRATEVAARHLSYLRDRYPDAWIGAYNRGPRRRADEAGRSYAERVERVYRRLSR